MYYPHPGSPAQTQAQADLGEAPTSRAANSKLGQCPSGAKQTPWTGEGLAPDLGLSLSPPPSESRALIYALLGRYLLRSGSLQHVGPGTLVHCLASGIDMVSEESFPRRAELGNVIKITQKSSFWNCCPE